jgi:hypothetical protein
MASSGKNLLSGKGGEPFSDQSQARPLEYGEQRMLGWAKAPQTRSYRVEIRPLLVATIQRLPQRTIESIFPTPGTVSPRDAFQIPLGPSRTAVPPLTSRIVQPSIVVGLVSGTGVGLVETCVLSAAGPAALVFCFFGNRTKCVVFAPRFGVSCARPIPVAVAVGLVSEPGTSRRSDLARSAGAADESTCLTRSEVGVALKKFELAPTQPRPRQSNDALVIITMRRPLMSRSGATERAIRSRLSILISQSHANAASGGVSSISSIGRAPELFRSAVTWVLTGNWVGPSRAMEDCVAPNCGGAHKLTSCRSSLTLLSVSSFVHKPVMSDTSPSPRVSYWNDRVPV